MNVYQKMKFLNAPAPQTVTGPGVSAVLGHSDVYVQATAACFICVSADGTGVDGEAVGATNGHFMPAGGSYTFYNLNETHKIGVSAGTLYISAIG